VEEFKHRLTYSFQKGFQIQGALPCDPPGPRWGLCPQTPVISSRSRARHVLAPNLKTKLCPCIQHYSKGGGDIRNKFTRCYTSVLSQTSSIPSAVCRQRWENDSHKSSVYKYGKRIQVQLWTIYTAIGLQVI